MGVANRQQHKMGLVFMLFIVSSMASAKEIVTEDIKTQGEETTRDPWAPCEDDSACPAGLMCNIYQNRCTECMENKDCPPCIEDDCPYQGDGFVSMETIAVPLNAAEICL